MFVDRLDVRIYEDRRQLGRSAAAFVGALIDKLLVSKDELNIIFGAAPSQNEFLEELLELNIDWNRINAFHMDEYIGLEANAPQEFGNFLRERLFDRVKFKNVFLLDGNAESISEECGRYAKLLRQHPTDIVCLGIGENGHLAFNDPPVADFNDPEWVKEVDLDLSCRVQQVNDGCFNSLEEVPTHAITLTIPALMHATYAPGIVPGTLKANAVYNTLNKDVEHQYPSTVLRTHPNAVLFLDRDSSGLLKQQNL